MARLSLMKGSALLALVGFAAAAAPTLVPNNNPWRIASLDASSLAGVGARLADPANHFSSFGGAQGTPSFRPEGSTILIPSTNSNGVDGTIAGGTITLTLNGLNFDVRPGLTVGLGTAAGGTNCIIDGAIATQAVVRDSTTRARFVFPSQARTGNGWDSDALELEEIQGVAPRPICLIDGVQRKWTGFFVQVVWECQEPSNITPANRLCNDPAGFNPIDGIYSNLNEFELAALKTRTVCCRSRLGLGGGRCINPNTGTCCGGARVTDGAKCCSRIVETSSGPSTGTSGNEVVVPCDGNCPCRSANEVTINGVATNTDCAGNKGDRGDATETHCCLPNKDLFPAFADAQGQYLSGLWGTCISPTSPEQKCCINGQTYGPNQKCCEVNGVVNRDVPCQCASDAECQTTHADEKCCKASGPNVDVPTTTERCNRFENFPANIPPTIYGSSGAALADRAVCHGACYDPSWQTCCNGNLCNAKYERCCNDQCCNRHTQTCERTHHRHAQVQLCSRIEHLSEFRAFFVFVLPAVLLFASLGALAIVIVFANRASNRSYSFIETAMVFFATIAALFALPTFFSPAFKYGVLIVLTALVAIVAAAARIRMVNVGLIVMLAITLWYIFDPTPANHWFTASSFTKLNNVNAARSTVEEETDGLFRTVTKMWSDGGAFCTDFYDGYFQIDGALHAGDIKQNPADTKFGYCERGWVATLLVLAGVSVVAVILLFVVAILALVLRFRKV